MHVRTRNQKQTKKEKKRKAYYKKTLLCMLKSYIWVPLFVGICVMFLNYQAKTHYIGNQSALHEVSGVCTGIRKEVNRNYRNGPIKSISLLVKIENVEYEIHSKTAYRIIETPKYDEFYDSCVGSEIKILYTGKNNYNVASLSVMQGERTLITLEETAGYNRPNFIFVVCAVAFFTLLLLVFCTIFFMANKPAKPYFLTKQ